MPAVGLDISADAIRFLELRPARGGLVLGRYAAHNFPLGTFEGGIMKAGKVLKDTITTFAKEHGLAFANVALPEEKAYLANIRIPRVAPKEVRGAIELVLEEHVPISGADAVFDYVEVNADSIHQKDHRDVVVSVLPRDTIGEFVELFRGTGITPLSFEFESQAMARALVPAGDLGTFLVVDIGKMQTNVFVVARGVVQFSASLDIGGHHLTQAIARGLGLSYEEAEEEKVKKGLTGSPDEKIVTAMVPVVTDFKTRLLRHYAYWQTHHGEKVGGNIESILLAGGGANLRGLSEFLGTGVDVPVAAANPWVNIASFEAYISPIPRHKALAYATAIGLALRSYIHHHDQPSS